MRVRSLNAAGASLIEMMVGMAILGISVLATLAMQKANLAVQRQNTVVNTIQELQNKMRTLIMDNNSWAMIKANTTAGAASMNCFANSPQTSCTGSGGVFNVYEASGALFYTSLLSDSSAGNGFTEKGVPCNTFNPAGNSECPIGYVISWVPVCTAPCINPAIQVTVSLQYKPSDGDAPVVNVNKYSSTLTRGAMAITKSFMMADSPAVLTAGGGACPGGTTVTRSNLTIPAGGDPFSLIKASTGSNFTIGRGTYKCSVNGFGFAVDAFTLSLVNNASGAVVGTGTAFAPRWVQTATSFETVFSITADTVFTLQQTCASNPSGAPGIENLALGMPAAPYTTRANFATIVCSLVD